MKFHIIGTGSNGNSYIMQCEENKEVLLLECGMKLIEVKKALDFDISNIKGCLLTHCHGDHSKFIKEYLSAGINIYSSKETFEALGLLNHHRCIIVEEKKVCNIPNSTFKFIPYNIQHDCPQGFCYFINQSECGNTLFLTDSFYIPYKFANLNNIIVEANYCENILAEREKIHPYLRDRIITSHMSLQTCEQMLQANDLRMVQNVVLIHLSDSNSNEVLFRNRISEITNKNVVVASNKMCFDLNKTPF
jgi:phosphoribosyl 1,2-cyclic phosphodiesterase